MLTGRFSQSIKCPETMFNNHSHYKGKDIAVVIPTKDRPAKVGNLLTSIQAQSIPCGRIIIIDGSESAQSVARTFESVLPVEYYRCRPPGQIRQRNMAIGLLTPETPLVCLFDDDIVLCDLALETMLDFWNCHSQATAGVSFNVMNNTPDRFTRLLEFISGGRISGGRVFKSGLTTSNCQVPHDLRTQWLCGGATVWRQEILRRYSHREIPARWAINEDLVFSYPIGKQFPLYVCAAAQVRHEHEYDYAATDQFHFKGMYETMWRIYFIRRNPELSLNRFLGLLIMMALSNFLGGLCKGEGHSIRYAWGQLDGARKILRAGSDLDRIVAVLTDPS